MEFINRIELAGVVGTSSIKMVGDSKVCRFSLATEYSYRGHDGGIIIDCTWFNICVFDGKGIKCDLNQIVRGSKVHIIGRFRCSKYTDAQGNDRSCYEVLASEVEIIEED